MYRPPPRALVRPQRGSYSAPDDPTRRPFDFALLREEPAPEGVRVAATNEAINVLVGALDTDIASAHSAADAKLASLISRRRFGEAEAAARDARIRSIQYMADVRRIIADTRLDVRRAGWGDRVPAQMDEIVGHLAAQMEVERRMLEAMRDSRDEAEDPALAASAQRLVTVVEEAKAPDAPPAGEDSRRSETVVRRCTLASGDDLTSRSRMSYRSSRRKTSCPTIVAFHSSSVPVSVVISQVAVMVPSPA